MTRLAHTAVRTTELLTEALVTQHDTTEPTNGDIHTAIVGLGEAFHGFRSEVEGMRADARREAAATTSRIENLSTRIASMQRAIDARIDQLWTKVDELDRRVRTLETHTPPEARR